MSNCYRYTDLQKVNEAEWDSIISPKDWLHSYRFLHSLQTAQVENASMHFLMVYEAEKLIGTAVLSAFSIHLDLFITAQKTVNFIKKISPHFFKSKILFAGIPLSAGQKNIYSLPGKEKVVSAAIYASMQNIAKQNKIKTLVIKELNPADMKEWQAFVHFGFIPAWSIPSTDMHLSYEQYDIYLQSLKSKYRRQIRHSQSKMNRYNFIKTINNKAIEESHIGLLQTSDLDYQTFYFWYEKVMNRTQTKLEMLNIDFFKNLWQNHASELKILGSFENGQPKAAIIFTAIHDEINFLWSAKDFEKDAVDSYFNLLNALVAFGINYGYKKIVLGQTAYYPKMKIGGQLSPRQFYIKSNNKLIHFLFKKCSNLLFPPANIQQLKVFNKQYDLS